MADLDEHELLLDGRRFTWRVMGHRAGKSVDVRSGAFALRATLRGLEAPGYAVFIYQIAIIGTEFPVGIQAVDPPFLISTRRRLDGDRHGIVHDGLVRTMLQRLFDGEWCWRQPLNEQFRAAYDLPTSSLPASVEELRMYEHAELKRALEQQKRELALKRMFERDALITSRRCPVCAYPCPSYRVTCKRCGRDVRGDP